jgi:uncharacterized protein YqeY
MISNVEKELTLNMLEQTIRNKFNEARKSKNELMRKPYESVIAKIMVAEKSGKYVLPLSEDVIVSLLQKEVKELEETKACYLEIPPFTTIEDKVADALYNLDVQIAELKQYLPAALTEEEVIEKIKEVIDSGETNKGKIIGTVAKLVGSRFDKSKIAGLVAKVMVS